MSPAQTQDAATQAAATQAARLRGDAERMAAALPALQASAERLAATIALGAHGRRRPGVGETFWQYRRAGPGDAAASIDWRRSARSDALFVRETEWEAAQTIWLWCDRSASMRYRSSPKLPTKLDRAAELTAALAVLLVRGGERIAVLGGEADGAARPAAGESQLSRTMRALVREDPADFAAPPSFEAARSGRVVLIGDMLGEEEPMLQAIRAAAGRGLRGLALQVVDPAEESFPFDGRVTFESMARSLRYDTERADALRADYRAALEARRGRLDETARRAGWRFSTHRSSESAAPALLWLARGLSGDRVAGL